jgi:hypothetical protein
MTKYLILFLIFIYTIYCSNIKQTTEFLSRNMTNIETQMLLADGTAEAYCFVNLDGTVYDLNKLYDPNADYFFKANSKSYYFNFCKFGVSKCKKDNTYIIASNQNSLIKNQTNDCTLLSGTNYQTLPKWRINSKIIFNFRFTWKTYKNFY